MRLATISLVIGLAGAAAGGGAGCEANRRVMTQGAENPRLLQGGESEAEVLRAWGDPDRRIVYEDTKTGRTLTIWQYDRFLDTNGSRATTSLTFENGKVYQVDRHGAPRSIGEFGPGATPWPRDSSAKRDME